MKQILKRITLFIFCFSLAISPVNVMAIKQGGNENGDIDELEHNENDYGDVTFKGKVEGKNDKKYFYITVINKNTGERFSFNFSKKNKMIVKGKLPLGDYEIQEGGVSNDWTGLYSPENVKFSINDRSAAKIVQVTFGSPENSTESKKEREKIYQVQQKHTKTKAAQSNKNSQVVKKTDQSSERNFFIAFAIGFLLSIGILTFITRFIKKFR